MAGARWVLGAVVCATPFAAGATTVTEYVASGPEADLFVRVATPDHPKRTLIALHGGPGTSHGYMRVLERLVEHGVTVVTYDQRGVGQSTGPDDTAGYTLDAYVSDLEGVRASLDVDRVSVLGHSWGGVVLMAYAQAHPDRVDGLVLVGSGAPHAAGQRKVNRATRESKQRLERDHPAIAQTIPEGLHESCHEWWPFIASYYADSTRAAPTELPGTCHPDVMKRTLDALGEFDVTPGETWPNTRTLVLYGRQDPIAVAAADVVRAMPPDYSEQVWIENCGHRPMFECPEPFFDTLVAFLTGPG